MKRDLTHLSVLVDVCTLQHSQGRFFSTSCLGATRHGARTILVLHVGSLVSLLRDVLCALSLRGTVSRTFANCIHREV